MSSIIETRNIPHNAKPIKPEISNVMMPLFSFLILGSFGKINEISFVEILCTV